MSDLYCPSCGALHRYSGKRPKFCSSCGDSIDDLASFAASSENPEDNHLSTDISSLSMEIAVEVDKGSELSQAGDHVGISSKGTKRFTKRDFVAQPSTKLTDMRRETNNKGETS